MPKEMSLEATAEDRQRFCSRDVLISMNTDCLQSDGGWFKCGIVSLCLHVSNTLSFFVYDVYVILLF